MQLPKISDVLMFLGLSVLALTIVGCGSFLIKVAYDAIQGQSKHQAIIKREEQLPKTITSVGRMITLEHDGHLYVVFVHGQSGVHFVHSPSCLCSQKAEK